MKKIKESDYREKEKEVLGIIDSKDTLIQIANGQEEGEFFEDYLEEIYHLFKENRYTLHNLTSIWYETAIRFKEISSYGNKNLCYQKFAQVVCRVLRWI